MDDYCQVPYSQLRYCVRCCMPETNEGMQFDEMGICLACRAAEEKQHINWVERGNRLRGILERYRSKDGSNYDCLVPISGGKDSSFQLHVIVKVFGLKPLAVTFSHNWFSPTGRYNLENILEKLNVDHFMFTPNRDLVNRIARRSLELIGDACWTCHSGVGAFPLQVAVRFEIPLLIWGESIAEHSGRATYNEPVHRFDRDYFTKVSAKVWPEALVCDDITLRELKPFELPSWEDLERVGVVGIHLGDYIFWDEERQMEFVRKHYDWREDYVEGAYKGYKSVECRMAGVHDYCKFIKRGFGRGTDQACRDVRHGLMTREEGLRLAHEVDADIPPALVEYLRITGYTPEEFYNILVELREGKATRLPRPDPGPLRKMVAAANETGEG
ncbi:MAG: N-acetyl sugar amidotransferase [Proteobacteria bacterium]|nr:N-acetyl sugar amidotransferase [Pseudomonadota bacterium]